MICKKIEAKRFKLGVNIRKTADQSGEFRARGALVVGVPSAGNRHRRDRWFVGETDSDHAHPYHRRVHSSDVEPVGRWYRLGRL